MMKKRIRIFLTVVCGVLVVKLLLTVIVSCFPFDYSDAEKELQKNKKYLLVVCGYLKNAEHNSIYIPDSIEHGTMSISGQQLRIENAEVVQAIETLQERGYQVIGKADKTIHFQRWSNLDKGHGIAYAVEGEQLKLQFLTRKEALSEPNWYYYEEDFNVWKNTKSD